jgi:hypothetical protein
MIKTLKCLVSKRRHFRNGGTACEHLQPTDLNGNPAFIQAEFSKDGPECVQFLAIPPI